MDEAVATTLGGASGNRTHDVRRVRHELRRRTLTVTDTELLNRGMLRIRFRSPDLGDFPSAGADDHIKLVLPTPDGTEVRRDYTPRAFDRDAGTLTVDFALHAAPDDVATGAGPDGPATAWAKAARPGDTLLIGGPRGSMLVPDTFDWFVLVGDTTALPAIGRRVEELGAGVPVFTVVQVEDASEAQHLDTRARWNAQWLTGGGAASVCEAVDRVFPAEGDGFVWIAGEASWMQHVRDHVLERHRHPKEWMRAAGYWVEGRPLDD